MPASMQEFWKRLHDSQLLDAQSLADLQAEWQQQPAVATGLAADALAAWLIERGHLSRYQADVLLVGESGPFDFGDYRIHSPFVPTHSPPGWETAFHGQHRATGYPVLLRFLTQADVPNFTAWQTLVRQIERDRRLTHPYLVQIWELLDLSHYRVLVTDDVPESSLAATLSAGQTISAGEAAELIRQLSQVLAYLHQNHRQHGALDARYVWLGPSGSQLLLAPPQLAEPNLPAAEDLDRLIQLAEELAVRGAAGTPADPLAEVVQSLRRQQRQAVEQAGLRPLSSGDPAPPNPAADAARTALAAALNARRVRLRAAAEQFPNLHVTTTRHLSAGSPQADLPLPAVVEQPTPAMSGTRRKRQTLPMTAAVGLWAVALLGLGGYVWFWSNRTYHPVPGGRSLASRAPRRADPSRGARRRADSLGLAHRGTNATAGGATTADPMLVGRSTCCAAGTVPGPPAPRVAGAV